ncbi:NAD(P)H-binding protein [Fulvivirga maritima]|uniref:SDR family oxidoreductase n=1 Tax=Fulvivirga maritima TaxID=2904247 RepID=UPI001F28CD5C|nr:NAD(P)H-binding protein [Fulvivirga maritima]UII26796.1 NAD(P)H-binding protein [Fulvivirga maritima]
MREHLLLLGASGSLGLEIAKRLKRDSIPFRGQTTSSSGEEKLKPYTDDIWIVDPVANPESVKGVTEGVTTVISGMGKSVSLFKNSQDTFYEVDYLANAHILSDAIKNKVSYYIYVSIKEAGHNDQYAIPKSHKQFEESLHNSKISHCILRPVGFYSGLHDLAIMAKHHVIPVIGNGEAKTNSMAQGDMAEVVISTLKRKNTGVHLIGGPKIHTRYEMAKMIKDRLGGKIIKIPSTVADVGAVLPQIFDKNLHEKMGFFKYITTHDMIGEKNGTVTFEEYLNTVDINDLS